MATGKRSAWIVVFLLVFLAGVGFVGLAVLAALFGDGPPSFSRSPVAILNVEGPIFESIETLKKIDDLYNDDHVRAIVVRVDSPGGAVAPSQEIFRELKRLKEKSKTVVVSMGTVAASGGYYIATAADKIVANPGTITGSIGVIMQSFGVKDLVKKFMIDPRIVKSGAYKDAGSPFRDMTESEISYFQNLSDDIYEQFLRDVSKARDIPLEKMRDLAQGRIYSGSQAKEKGLVDELGNLFDAIALAKKLSGLPEEASVRWPSQPSAFEKWFASGAGASMIWQNFFEKMGFLTMPMWMKGMI